MMQDRLECAGRAKQRRRFGFASVDSIQSGVALRLPPHSNFFVAAESKE